MRILHVAHQYPPEHVGGTELYTQSLAREQARRGHEVAVFARVSRPGEGLVQERESGVAVWRAWHGRPSAARRFIATLGNGWMRESFRQVLHQERPDLVHVQHLMGLPASLVADAARAGVTLVVSLHDYWWACANAQRVTNDTGRACAGPARAHLNCARCAAARAGGRLAWLGLPLLVPLMALRRRVLRRALGRVSRCVAPSRYVADWYAAQGLCQPTVVPHGIAAPPASPPPPGPPPLRLAYVGGLAWQKGVHVIVEAVRGLRGSVELEVIGPDGPDASYVRRLARDAPPSVRFLGPQAREGVVAALARAHLLLVPSLWPETFCLSAWEALAAGVPVLASDMGALPEAVADGRGGMLLPAGDVEAWRGALQQVLDDPTRLEAWRRDLPRPLTLAEHAARIEAVYQEARGRSA